MYMGVDFMGGKDHNTPWPVISYMKCIILM